MKGNVYSARLDDVGNFYGQLGTGMSEDTKDPKIRPHGELVEVAAELVAKTFMKTGDVPDPLIMKVEAMIPDPVVTSIVSDPKLMKLEPVPVKNKILDIAAGSNHSLLICRKGKLWGFGRNEFLQLGMTEKAWKLEENRVVAKPVEISLPVSKVDWKPRAAKIAAGQNHSVINIENLDEDGNLVSSQIWAFGNGLLGQVGHGKV